MGHFFINILSFFIFFWLLSLQRFKALALQPNSSIEIEISKINRK